MAEYIDKLSVYKEACAGCTCHGDEIGSCFSSEPCERLCFAFASAHAADVVAVVRCEKCEYVRPKVNGYTGEQVGVWCYLWDEIDIGVDDYCSRGKPREAVI